MQWKAQKAMLMFDVELIVHSTITSKNMSAKAVHTMPAVILQVAVWDQCPFEERKNRLYKGS